MRSRGATLLHFALGFVGLMALGTAAVLAATGARQSALPTYEIIDLGTLGGSTSVALGVNEVGQVVGSADTAQGLRHAYIWENGVMTDLGTLPPNTQSEAWGVNNAGQVVGSTTTGGAVFSGFLWEDGVMINIGALSGSPSGKTSALGINDAGQIVGISTNATPDSHAFLWTGGVMTDLGTLGGDRSVAWDINSSGQLVVGAAYTQSAQHAFLWEDGVMTDLDPDGGFSQAFGINDAAQVVGWNGQAAILWEDGEMTDLGAESGLPASKAFAINNLGQVLAREFLYDTVTGAFADLHDRIPVDSGWSQLDPRAISDSGWIVGSGNIGGLPRAFLMTPLPPPPIPTVSRWGLIVLALIVLTGGTIAITRRRLRSAT